MQLNTPRDIGSLIKARRLAMRVSQKELATRVGVSRLWVVQTEHGNPGASLDLVLRTLAELDVTLVALEESADSLIPSSNRPPPVEGPDIGAVLGAVRRQ